MCNHDLEYKVPRLEFQWIIITTTKRPCRIVDFAVPADYRVKLKENEKRDKYQDLARGRKKTMEHESDADTNCNWCAHDSQQRIGKGTERIRVETI